MIEQLDFCHYEDESPTQARVDYRQSIEQHMAFCLHLASLVYVLQSAELCLPLLEENVIEEKSEKDSHLCGP